MSKQEPQSFEVAGYSDTEIGAAEAFKVIKQIFADLGRDAPAHAVWVDMTGDLVKIHYHTYVVNLPVYFKRVEEESNEILKRTVAHLKKEFKERTGKALKLTEQKELANHAVEKVSLNERYYYKCWRVFTLGGF